MEQAVYDKLKDGTFCGIIPRCKGVVAFGASLRECEVELQSTLEDWILVGLKLGHLFTHMEFVITSLFGVPYAAV
jgi:hypothetical protein